MKWITNILVTNSFDSARTHQPCVSESRIFCTSFYFSILQKQPIKFQYLMVIRYLSRVFFMIHAFSF